jgi:hypothetical protein
MASSSSHQPQPPPGACCCIRRSSVAGHDTGAWSDQSAFSPFLPDAREFLFLALGSRNAGIFIGSLDSPETKRLTAADTAAAYAPPGWLLFIRQGTLVVQRLDLSRRELTGNPVTVADPVIRDGNSVGAFQYRRTD